MSHVLRNTSVLGKPEWLVTLGESPMRIRGKVNPEGTASSKAEVGTLRVCLKIRSSEKAEVVFEGVEKV